jgi:hypothetical protein
VAPIAPVPHIKLPADSDVAIREGAGVLDQLADASGALPDIDWRLSKPVADARGKTAWTYAGLRGGRAAHRYGRRRRRRRPAARGT